MAQDPPSGKSAAVGSGAGAPADRIDPADPSSGRITLGRAAVPPDLNDPVRRKSWGLPEAEDQPGDYMIELNAAHHGGLRAAKFRFLKLYGRVVLASADRKPIQVGQTYYHCLMSVEEWRRLIQLDETLPEKAQSTPGETGPGPEARPGGRVSPGEGDAGADADADAAVKVKVNQRAIYRIWPDFPVKPQLNHSVSTIKGDAALLSYGASGKGIVWAVLDSGIDASHPHFGAKDGPGHTLLDPAVKDLHRDFSASLPDPDADAEDGTDDDVGHKVSETERQARVAAHRRGALADGYLHGTHVAGIIAGGLTAETLKRVQCRVFERKFNRDDQQREIPTTLEERTDEVDDPTQLRGVAPRCLLISLKVLDNRGFGRTSNVLRALDYVRSNLNANPKTMLVHGLNLSVGYEFDAQLFACGQSPICVEVDRLVQAGLVVVTAAGNTGYGSVLADQRRGTRVGLSNTINDPGNAALAITVGATHRDAPHTYGVSYFSSKGPTGDGRLKPDLVAPGERIISCAAGGNLTFIEEQLKQQGQPPIVLPPPLVEAAAPAASAAAAAPAGMATEPSSPAANAPPPQPRPVAAYIDESGTSMAAPHVSGAIAAFLSIRREFIGKPLEVKRIFLDSATALGRERYFEGNGLLDLMRAIQSV